MARKRNKQKYSEACRPFWADVDGVLGKLIDLTAVFALLAGTATTFSPGNAPSFHGLKPCAGAYLKQFPDHRHPGHHLRGIPWPYTSGMQGIAKLAASCVYLFFGLLAYFLLCGARQCYIIETGITAVGTWCRTSWAWPPGPMPCAPPPFPKTGPSFIGPTGWYGVLPPPSSSAPSAREGPSARLCWEVISSVSQAPLHPFIILGNYGLWTADARKAGPDGCLCKTGDLYNRPSYPYLRQCRGQGRTGSPGHYHDCLLCHFLRRPDHGGQLILPISPWALRKSLTSR